MTYEQILYEVEDRIATITLNRPEQLNAWTDTIAEEVWQAMHAANADRDVRVIVLTGAGRAFCAGGDITGMGQTNPRTLLDKLPRPFDFSRRADYQTRATWFPAIGKPVIGMLNGATAGLGLLHALCCDVRFGAEEAVFTTAFSRIGLTAEYGMAWMLERVVGHAQALELLLSARRVSGTDAWRIGLVHFVHPRDALREATYAYARDLAQNVSPRSMRILKQQMYEVPFQTLAEAVRSSSDDMLVANVSADFKEGVAAFKEKRRPRFPDDER